MKLLIILSVIACSYGDKLDRTYLPPESAATAGGSPGSITAPGTETVHGIPKGTSFGSAPGQTSGPSSFGQLSGPSSFGQPSGPSFGQPTGSAVGQPSGPTFGQSSGPSFGQPSGPSFGQPTGSAIGQPSGPSLGQPSGPSVGQSSGPSFGQASSGPSYDRQGQNQAGSAQPGQLGSQYTQAGNSDNAPGFTQVGTGFNNAPVFNSQSQAPTSYNGPSQPERARASIDRNAETLHYENNIDGDTFAYSFETSNGIAADEAGIATNGVRAQGGFSYTGDDGQFYSVRYTADENGYVPQGDHLPTPHPIPEEILKSLEENAKAAAAGTQEGAYNPNEDSNLDNSASYPAIGSNAYQPVQDSISQYNGPDASSVTARPQDGQEFGSKYNTGTSFRPQGSLETSNAQYDTPKSSLNNYNRPGSSNNVLSGSQYGNSSPTTSRPGSQGSNSPTSQYTGSFRPGLSSQGTTIPTFNTPTDTINIGQKGSPRPGSPLFSQDRPTFSNQYGTSDSSSTLPTSPSFPVQGSQSLLINKVPSFGSSSEFPKQLNQSPVSQTGASTGSTYGSKRPFESPNIPSQIGAQSPTSQTSTFPTSGLGSLGQNSGYQYNSPSSLSSGTRPGTQKFNSQASSSSAPQFGALSGSTSGSNKQIRPQDFTSGSISGSEPSRPYNSQPATSQYNRPVSSFSRPEGTSLATQYNTPAVSPFGIKGLSGSQNSNAQYETSVASSEGLEGSRPIGSQSSTSQYTRPTSSSLGSKATDFSKPVISSAEGQITQKQDESGYKYSQPQTQFGQQDGKLSGSIFRPSDSGASTKPINKENTIGSGLFVNNYNPSGSSGSTPKGISNASEFPKFQVTSNKNYPSGQSPTDNQDSAFPGSGQYSSTGLGSRPTDSTFPRRDKPNNTPTYQFGQIGASKSPMLDSAPYQYNRPGSQEPGQVGSQQIFGSLGQERPGQIGSQQTFGSSGQQRPGQIGSQTTFGASGQERPGQVGSQPTFGSSGQERPGKIGSQPTFGASGQERPGQIGFQPTFGLSGQQKPGQIGSQTNFGSIGQERPGQVGSQQTFGSSGQQRPGQIGSQTTFGASRQERPGQVGSQSTFGSSGQERPGKVGSQTIFGASGQEKSGQVGSQQTFGSSGQQRPGQIGSQTTFGASRQERPGQVGSQSTFGSTGQEKPGQVGSQTVFGASGQEKSGQVGSQQSFGSSGQQRPGQIGSQTTFGASRQERPGQVGTQSTFGSTGQERPGQVGSQPIFGSSGQKILGQVSSQSTFGSSEQEKPGPINSQSTFATPGQNRPGQVGYQPTFGSSGPKLPERPGQFQPGYDSLNKDNRGQTVSQSGYDYSKPNRPGQIGSQSNFSPSSQNVPSQTGTQTSFGFAGQDRPSQSADQPNFGSTGQQRPDQKEFPSGSGTVGSKGLGLTGYQSPQFTSARQDRPGQFGNGKPTENFNGPRQPPSFSPEEGYKY